jgi:hypothetical protein
MKGTRRSKLVAAGGALAVAAVTAVAAAAAGIPGQTPGGYQLDDINAHASFTPSSTSYGIAVEQGTYTFTPIGGPPSTVHATIVGWSVFGPTTGANGCFMVPDSSLTINTTAHTINLNVTLTAAEMIAMSPLPVESDLQGFGGKGGSQGVCSSPFGTLTLPVTLNVTWTPNTPATSLSKQANYSCSGFTAQTKESTTMIGTNATTGSLSDTFSGVANEHVTMSVQGPGAYPAGCNLPTF